MYFQRWTQLATWIPIQTDRQFAASPRLLATSSDNTTTSWLRSRVSSVTPGSGTTVFMPSSTLSRRLAMGKLTISLVDA